MKQVASLCFHLELYAAHLRKCKSSLSHSLCSSFLWATASWKITWRNQSQLIWQVVIYEVNKELNIRLATVYFWWTASLVNENKAAKTDSRALKASIDLGSFRSVTLMKILKSKKREFRESCGQSNPFHWKILVSLPLHKYCRPTNTNKPIYV